MNHSTVNRRFENTGRFPFLGGLTIFRFDYFFAKNIFLFSFPLLSFFHRKQHSFTLAPCLSPSKTKIIHMSIPLSTTTTTTSVAIAPFPAQQQWGNQLPPPPPLPSNLILRTSLQDLYLNPFGIVNRHSTLSTLIDAAYPRNRCFTCDSTFTSRSETDQHLQTHHHTKGYLCLYPHCDQVFRSRGVLRFHIASCHVVVNEQVSKTDPLYLLYAPSDPTATLSSATDNGNTMVPKKRKYERRRKAWNPMSKSSLPGQTNFALTPGGAYMHTDPSSAPAVPAKRRGRPPKNSIIMDAVKAKIIPPHTTIATEPASVPTLPISTPVAPPPLPTPASTPVSAPPVIAPPPPPPPLVASSPPPPPKVFRLVQQVIPSHAVSSSSPSSTLKGRANLSLQSKTLLAEKYNPLRCPSCHLGFKRKTNVVKHLTAVHYGEECFQCIYPTCDHPKRFSTREGLVYHILRMHDNVDHSGDS